MAGSPFLEIRPSKQAPLHTMSVFVFGHGFNGRPRGTSPCLRGALIVALSLTVVLPYFVLQRLRNKPPMRKAHEKLRFHYRRAALNVTAVLVPIRLRVLRAEILSLSFDRAAITDRPRACLAGTFGIVAQTCCESATGTTSARPTASAADRRDRAIRKHEALARHAATRLICICRRSASTSS